MIMESLTDFVVLAPRMAPFASLDVHFVEMNTPPIEFARAARLDCVGIAIKHAETAIV